ncbi:MAG TPA: hypothetical protein VI504_13230 [Candidatus Eisenbacteria bacterium]
MIRASLRSVAACALTCLLPLAIPGVARDAFAAGAKPRLWVLQPGGNLVEFDSADFSRLESLKLPPAVLSSPGRLAINAGGQILCALGDDQYWTWDGRTSRTFGSVSTEHPLAAGALAAADTSRQWFLGADGSTLFVAENAFAKTLEADGNEKSVVNRVRVLQTDFSGRTLGELATFAFPPCECATGSCSETCPEALVWAPEGVVGDFFFLTHVVPGQIGATYGPTFLYRAASGGWRAFATKSAGDSIADASAGGAPWIEIDGDGGCCGWTNQGSDRATLYVRDTSQVVFDEWTRYRNQDYDVSFYLANARLAPGNRRAAYTIRATETAIAELRLSDDGHADPAELAAIRRGLAELPVVEVCGLSVERGVTLRLAHADLVGWASDHELLVVEADRLVAVDVITKRERATGITLRGAGDAYLVR